MGTVAFDYSALADARKYAKNVATGSLGMEDYSAGIASRLHNPIQDGWLAAYEPYGHSYTGSARTCIKNKQNDLATKQQIWLNLSNNLDQFLEYLKETDKAAADCFKTTKEAYTSHSGFWGGCQAVHDFFYNVMAVEVANSNGLTRALADFGKEVWDDYVTTAKMDAEDFFRHGEGRYYMNMLGSGALLLAAVVGVVISFLSLPFTGGASCAPMVGCVSVVGLAASGISAAISAVNTKKTIEENLVALSIEDDPAMARFHGDVTRYSDYVKKTDFGSKEANESAAAMGSFLDTTQAVADVVSLGCGLTTTLGAKKVTKTALDGRKYTFTSYDFSPSNVGGNLLNTFGIKATKATNAYDQIGTLNKTSFGTLEDIKNPSMLLAEGHIEATAPIRYKGALDGEKFVKKGFTIGEMTVSTDFRYLAASDGYVTQEVGGYLTHFTDSTLSVNYSNVLSTNNKVAAAKAAKNLSYSSVKNAKAVAEKTKKYSTLVSNIATGLKSEDETQRNMIISEVAKTNYCVSQVDKYIYKYDAAKDKSYIGGDYTKKVGKLVDSIK